MRLTNTLGLAIASTLSRAQTSNLERALSAPITARGPSSPTERDLREQIAKADMLPTLPATWYQPDPDSKPETIEQAIAKARTLTECMRVPYTATADVDLLVMTTRTGDKP